MVLVLLFVIYNVVRALPSTTAQVAVEHAHLILSWEGPLFRQLELPLNQWLAATPVLAVAACYFYAGLHYLATPAILLLARRRGGWPYWRGYWTLVHAKQQDVCHALQRGDAFFSRLEGEWCLRFC